MAIDQRQRSKHRGTREPVLYDQIVELRTAIDNNLPDLRQPRQFPFVEGSVRPFQPAVVTDPLRVVEVYLLQVGEPVPVENTGPEVAPWRAALRPCARLVRHQPP